MSAIDPQTLAGLRMGIRNAPSGIVRNEKKHLVALLAYVDELEAKVRAQPAPESLPAPEVAAE